MNPADTTEMPPGAAETAVLLALFGAGMAALVTQTLRDRKHPPSPQLPPWRASLLDFALWLWIMLIVFLGGQLLGGALLPRPETEGASASDTLTLPVLLVSLACTQGLWLLAQLAMLRWAAWSPAPLNREPPHAGKILGEALLSWLALYPLLFATALLWRQLLGMLRHWIPDLETPVQEPVRLLMESGDPAMKALIIFAAVVLAPVCEELFFRGGVYRFLKGRAGPLTALVVANLLFALIHFNVLSFLPLFLVGVLLTRAYERSGQIAVPIIFHALFNAGQIALLLLLPDVPGILPEGS